MATGDNLFTCHDPSNEVGATGRGSSVAEAIGHWAQLHQEELGLMIVIDSYTASIETERRERELRRRYE